MPGRQPFPTRLVMLTTNKPDIRGGGTRERMKKIGKLGGKDGDGRFSFMMVQIRLTMLATLLCPRKGWEMGYKGCNWRAGHGDGR